MRVRAAAIRWGYFTLPVLDGDELAGKLDALADREAGVHRVHAIHSDIPFTRPMTAVVTQEIKDLAHWIEFHRAPLTEWGRPPIGLKYRRDSTRMDWEAATSANMASLACSPCQATARAK